MDDPTRNAKHPSARSRALGTALLAATLIGTLGCASHRYDAYGNHYYETHGSAHATRGAVLGGLAGAGVGRAIAGRHNDAAGYWIGGALGAITGAVIGDAIDRDEARRYDPHRDRGFDDHPDRGHDGRHEPGYDDGYEDRHDDGWWEDDDSWDDEYGERHSSSKPPPSVLSLPDEVLFEKGSATLARGAERRLRSVAQALRRHPGTVVVVRGHASAREGRAGALAEARARAVREHLIGQGVAPSRVTAIGMGARFPVASERSAEGRQRNRRAELELLSARERELAGLW